MKSTLASLLLFGASAAWASGEHTSASKDAPSQVGASRAVTAFDPEEGFKMSDRALQTLGVQFSPIEGKGPWTIPGQALVGVKHSIGVYRRNQGWISFVLVKVIRREGGKAMIQSEDLQAKDEVAILGASFLRLTEADLNSDTVDNCGH